jgi:hypothetical protein
MNLVFTFSLFQLVFFHSRLFMLLPLPLWAPSLGGFSPHFFLGNFVNTCRVFFFFFCFFFSSVRMVQVFKYLSLQNFLAVIDSCLRSWECGIFQEC